MDDKKDLKNKEDTEIPTIVLDIKRTCGTYEANIGFFIIAFGIPGILILILSFPYITFKDIIASSILIGIALWGIFFFGK